MSLTIWQGEGKWRLIPHRVTYWISEEKVRLFIYIKWFKFKNNLCGILENCNNPATKTEQAAKIRN